MITKYVLVQDEVVTKLEGTKYGVVVIGRNEELGIGQCLESVLNQKLKAQKVIFVNDNSIDRTREIAESFRDVEIIDFDEEHETWVDSPNLAKIVNKGIMKIGEIEGIDFILTMGGDTIIPADYTYEIIEKMLKHPEIVVASGKMNGEYNHVPRGTARVTNMKYWKKIGLGYRVMNGYEGYHFFKAGSMDLSYRIFNIKMDSSKKTGVNYSEKHWFNEGISAKALGYYLPYVMGKSILLSRKSLKCGVSFFKGYLSNKNEFYEKEVRDYVRSTQKNLIFRKRSELKNIMLRR